MSSRIKKSATDRRPVVNSIVAQGVLVGVALVLGFLPGCVLVVEDNPFDCEGYPERVRSLPDIEIAVGEMYERDLERRRAEVFEHTEDEPLEYEVFVDDEDVAYATVGRRSGRLRVGALAPGATVVTVYALDECDEEAVDRFVVDVREP